MVVDQTIAQENAVFTIAAGAVNHNHGSLFQDGQEIANRFFLVKLIQQERAGNMAGGVVFGTARV